MNEKNQILFQKYIDGQLDQSQRAAFESRLTDDAGFKSEFELYQMMNAHLEERNENKHALEVLDAVHRENAVPKESAKLFSIRNLMAAAAVGLLLMASIFFFKKQKPRQVQYADLYKEAVMPGSRGGDVDSLLVIALNDFESAPNQTVAKLKALDIDSDIKSRWITETFALHEMTDSVLFYLPQPSSDKLIRDRINYLEIISYWKLGDQAKVKTKIDELPEDTEEYFRKIYRTISD